MGTWDTGHFDNDSAADFAGELDGSAAGERTDLVREALLRAIGAGRLDDEDGAVAVAAAALVAAQCPGGPPVETVYGPDEPLPLFPAELGGLAARALDRVLADGSELRGLWADAEGESGPWLRGVTALRTALTAAASGIPGAPEMAREAH
ncbi:DUF4259 domain-containing protein [Streptomyces sp. AK02-01A]|uniref:DUF4259 domain-containing protein n=1 Tax=Streptomyces sp. AK02-01A TaxID=3028648 RepID=UPI0029B88276|nr:DUF4259 domain-containing protein [Streptomyces sp. AK02-01A]MDX3849517.1 DUF4259 domain-containing protein [Streptomyces sp. AK02-01A]MDX3849913.1 DUF4259 domain-containing protein [Streptomyces sp. AK02-01A]